MRKGKLFLIIITFILLLGAISVYLFIISQDDIITNTHPKSGVKEQASIIEDTTTVKVFYPVGLNLYIKEVMINRVFAPLEIAERALNELLSLEDIIDSGVIPISTKLIGLYYGINDILYIDLSQEFQRNFHGDIYDEYMLLKSIYETVMSNIEVSDIKILIQGKEVETIGGHFYIKYPLKQTVTQIMSIEEQSSDVSR